MTEGSSDGIKLGSYTLGSSDWSCDGASDGNSLLLSVGCTEDFSDLSDFTCLCAVGFFMVSIKSLSAMKSVYSFLWVLRSVENFVS
eukprot:scaffold39_cov142-Chaetoceros_neogracile.AAC.3